MSQEREKKLLDTAEEERGIDREVLDVMEEEKRKAAGRGSRDADADFREAG